MITIVQKLKIIIRYIFGRLPWVFCQLNFFAKLCITMQGVVLLDCIIITRYLLIFWIKNPGSFNDEFWSFFVNRLTLVFTFSFQLVLNLLPGKDFPDVWICSGTNPKFDSNFVYKSVWAYTVIKIVSFVLHIVIAIRIKIYKLKIDKEDVKTFPKSKMTFLFSVGRNSVIDIAESVTPLVLVVLAFLLNLPRKETNLESFNRYPDLLGEYFYTLVRPVVTILFAAGGKILSDKSLRKVLKKEMKRFLPTNSQIIVNN